MDTDNTNISPEETAEGTPDVSEQEELETGEEEVREREEKVIKEEEEITEEEEGELKDEEEKEEDNKIVDIESASEDEADGEDDKPQEDHDHQSDSVKSEDSAINEEALKNKLKKKASVVFERKASDGSSFWSLSARNSVTSMFEAEEGPEAGEAVQNPRKLLQKKRSSLAHQPDPGTLDRKESVQQQPEAVYEFQKVRMCGLRPVDNQSKEQKKDAEETEEDKNNGDSVEISGKKSDSINDGKSIKGEKKSKQPPAKAEAKKKVSAATNSGDKTSSVVGGKKKPISQKPGAPQKDSKSPASGVMRTSSTRQKNASKNVPKPKTSEPEHTSLPSNEGKKKPKSDPPPSKSQTRPPVERTMSARTSLGPKSDSRSDLKRTTSLRKQEQKPPVTAAPAKTTAAAARTVTKTGSKSNVKDNLDNDNSVTFRSRTQRTPPPVAPKPRPGDKIDLKDLASTPSPTNKKARSVQQQQQRKSSGGKKSSGNLTTLETKSSSSSVKPVMKKMAAKTSIAEMARLADTQKTSPSPASSSGSASKFVSHARATLSPAPTRKQRPIATVESDNESEAEKADNKEEEGEQSGIVSESVSASSVILMFGGTGKFKKTPGAANKESEEGKVLEDVEKSNEQIFKSTKKLSAIKKESTSMKSNNESSRKKSQPKKKSSVDSKVDRKTSNPRKSSQKSGDSNVIKTSLTVRLKSKNTEEVEKKVIQKDEDVLSKVGDTSHSAISTTEFDFQMSADKSR